MEVHGGCMEVHGGCMEVHGGCMGCMGVSRAPKMRCCFFP